MNKRTIVLIGGVAVGATAAARLRRLNENDEIIVLERNGYMSFANCGLPYYLGDVITDRAELVLQTPESFGARYAVDVRVYNEVTGINREARTLEVKNTKTGEVYTQSYDKLILGPGADPIVPPFEGLKDASNIFVLRNMEHTDAIHEFINKNNSKKAVVIGGGFIGVEVAENFIEKGMDVTLVDMAPQIMAPADKEFARVLETEMETHGVKFMFDKAVDRFENNGKTVCLKSGETLDADVVILAIGVRPATRFLQGTGIAMDERSGAIIVNHSMQTNDENIYAAGDSIMMESPLDGQMTLTPLAWPANRQARLIADHINGYKASYKGSLGTSVIKVFNYTWAGTGFNEKQLKAKGIKYEVVSAHRGSHAGYYPGATPVSIKMLFDKETGKIYGAQAVGQKGVEKRIDVIATAMNFGATASQLQEIEIAYAPPFSSAKDPVNILGYAAQNIIEGKYKTATYDQIDEIVANGGILIDVRTAEEFAEGHIKGAKNIPLDDLRNRMSELESVKDKAIYINCWSAQRSYLATQILRQNGFNNLYNLAGGYATYSVGTSGLLNGTSCTSSK